MNKVYVIAEAGVNHNGDLKLAHELVDAAADAGADAVKFQTFVPELLASSLAEKAAYQQRNQPDKDNQLEMLQKLALDFEHHHELFDHCQRREIDFLSSPFDKHSASFLIDKMELPQIKLGSGELTNGPLIWQLALSGRKLILSTGMATLDEIREALGLICHAITHPGEQPQTNDFSACFDARLLKNHVSLLHCTTEYPCPVDSVNLLAMNTLAETFGLTCGYSDHTQGINVSLAAVARGAVIIEKHFTLDRSLPGPDHLASLEPEELKLLVEGIRQIELALGSKDKQPVASERNNAAIARKSIIALQAISKGQGYNSDNIGCKRPGKGISPMRYWSLLDKTSQRDYDKDEIIE